MRRGKGKNKALVRGRLKARHSQPVSHHLWDAREGPHFQIRAHTEGRNGGDTGPQLMPKGADSLPGPLPAFSLPMLRSPRLTPGAGEWSMDALSARGQCLPPLLAGR